MRIETLWIPGRLPGLNEIIEARGSASGKANAWASMKKKLQGTIALLARAHGVGRWTAAHFAYVHFEPNRMRDPSNFCSGAQKVVEDALQKAKLIPNDGWRQVLSFQHLWHVSDDPGTMVVLSDEMMDRAQIESAARGVMNGKRKLTG